MKTKIKTKKRTARPRDSKRRAGNPWHPKEAQDIVLAIRRGKVDAVLTEGIEGDQVLTLKGSEHPYRVLVETINDGVATLDETGTILFANSRFAAILRLPTENFIGTSLDDYVSSSDREMLRNLIAKGLSSGTQGEIALDAAQKRPRVVRLVLHPMTNSDQKSVCVVATELTELVEANEALRSNEESLRQLSARLLKLQDEERRHIARDLHDITGQKLAAQSMGLARVLNSQPASMNTECRRILSESLSLNKQVGEEIRTLSYLLHPPLLDELGLASAVKWYAEGFQQRTGIRVQLEIDTDFPRLSPDVEVALFRVIQESLTNVHRYSGSKKAHVRVKAISDSAIEAEIRDFGKGIDRGMLDSTLKTVAPLGVGIQGMKQRMLQLAGKLEITSRLNQGTVVTATLPLLQASVPSQAEPVSARSPLSSPVAAETGAPNRSVSRKQILIADDHDILRRGIRSMLEAEQEWEICGEAVNGQEAVDKATALSPDLVILDINMPVLNGLAAVRQILRNQPQTKILIFTVHDSDQTQKEILAAGAHGYLSKSNAGDDLLKVVKGLLENEVSSFFHGDGRHELNCC